MLILTLYNTLPIKNIGTKIVSNSWKKKIFFKIGQVYINTRKHTRDDCNTCTSPGRPIVKDPLPVIG